MKKHAKKEKEKKTQQCKHEWAHSQKFLINSKIAVFLFLHVSHIYATFSGARRFIIVSIRSYLFNWKTFDYYL